MSRSYLPEPDDARAIWFTHFSQVLPNYTGQCTITPIDVGNIQKDALFWAFLVGLQTDVQRSAEGVTAYKNGMRDGLPRGTTGASIALPDLVAYPSTPPPPSPVAQGIFQRLRDFVARIKRAPDYVDSIGQALGIEPADTPAKRPEDRQPKVNFRGYNAGRPVLRVSRDGAPQVELLCDYADGKGMVTASILTRAEFTDMHALPPVGTAQVWRYQAICRDGAGRIGQMSEVLTVTVTGI